MQTPLGIGRGASSGGGLLKTGQTTQYGGYNDDGYYEKGTAKSYTVLSTGQYSGTVSVTLNSKTETKSNNCVQDNVTGLMWARYVSASVGPSSNGVLPWTTNAGGEGIFAYATAANAANLGGYNDWRVPNDTELMSIRDMEAPTGAPDAVAFPSWPTATQVWSATTTPNATTTAMYIKYADGYIYNAAKTTNYLTALVRG